MKILKYLLSLFLIIVLFSCKSSEKSLSDCVDKSAVDPNGICPTIYKPVCGCDGKTYGNDCEAERAGVNTWEEGECQ